MNHHESTQIHNFLFAVSKSSQLEVKKNHLYCLYYIIICLAILKMPDALIVDFPSNNGSSSASSKKVRFSPIIQRQYIRKPSSAENEAKSYSSEDYERFQQIMVRDAIKCSRKIATAQKVGLQDRETSEKHIIRCVGIDHLVSRNVGKRYQAIKEARRAHSDLVLDAYDWQLENHFDSPEALARVSMKSSQPFQLRSYKVALLASYVE